LGLDLEDFRPAWLELKRDRLFAGRAKQCLCMLIFFFFRQLRIGDVTGNHHQIRTRRQAI
jgi:hypothetical protein